MEWKLAPVVGVALLSLPAGIGAETREEKVNGYAEWRVGGCYVADAQRVCLAPGGKFKGHGEARDFSAIPLGYELQAKGVRQADGSLRAGEVEAKPNGVALFENEIRSATDDAESRYRRAGNLFETDHGRIKSIGRLYEDGPRVERVRRVVDSLLPPYLDPGSVRVYVVENKEWNAFAMGNYSIYVFSGLLDDMDDDEVAIVLGHELVHATHEHTRRQFKKQMWIQIAALGVTAAAQDIDDKTKRAVVQLLATFGAMAWSNGYGRDLEDQADRVGLRYAYEAGYDITKGPRLWNRFARKYGEPGKVANFFFGNHSQSSARAAKLEKELAFNYPDGAKPGGPVLRAAAPPPAAPAPAITSPPSASVFAPGTSASALAPSATDRSDRVQIKTGMTPEEVRQLLGDPRDEVVFGSRTRWTFPDLTVIFEGGRVTEVKF